MPYLIRLVSVGKGYGAGIQEHVVPARRDERTRRDARPPLHARRSILRHRTARARGRYTASPRSAGDRCRTTCARAPASTCLRWWRARIWKRPGGGIRTFALLLGGPTTSASVPQTNHPCSIGGRMSTTMPAKTTIPDRLDPQVLPESWKKGTDREPGTGPTSRPPSRTSRPSSPSGGRIRPPQHRRDRAPSRLLHSGRARAMLRAIAGAVRAGRRRLVYSLR